jgi:hypothetical protein
MSWESGRSVRLPQHRLVGNRGQLQVANAVNGLSGWAAGAEGVQELRRGRRMQDRVES